jgi:hypothetical protein
MENDVHGYFSVTGDQFWGSSAMASEADAKRRHASKPTKTKAFGDIAELP